MMAWGLDVIVLCHLPFSAQVSCSNRPGVEMGERVDVAISLGMAPSNKLPPFVTFSLLGVQALCILVGRSSIL